MSHIDLLTYFQIITFMKKHGNYSIHEIENIAPWERETYLQLLLNELEKEAEARKQLYGK